MVPHKSNLYSSIFFVCYLVRQTVTQCEVAQMCVTDFNENDCGPGETFVEGASVFGCCPRCQTGDVSPPSEEECKPPASCLPDGRFAPVQCKGDMFTGRCFCSDEKGNRIFGQMWRNEASVMTCACSRRRSELEGQGRKDVTLHCTPSGDYEPLQCDDGMCWCAQVNTGQPTVAPVLQEDMQLLPCYSATLVGENYLRRCESVVHALGMIHQEQIEHGTEFFGNPVTFCDYDGSYGAFQIIGTSAFCTDRAGEILGPWQAASNNMAGMNCNCARDTAMYFPERGMTVTETCQGNGNYNTEQIAGDVIYCVDSDGYPVNCTTVIPSKG